MRFPCTGILLLCITWPLLVHGGGPIQVVGRGSLKEGEPFRWNTTAPVVYRVDGGPLSQNPFGTPVIGNAAGVARVHSLFQVWTDVPTAQITFQSGGSILPVEGFSDGDVSTVNEFLAVLASCDRGEQSPIVFDANGQITSQLIGDPGVLGFVSICDVDADTATIRSAMATLNGSFQDGINNPAQGNFELTAEAFDAVFVHEFGHFAGLDHSQINLRCLYEECSAAEWEGLPTMFPFLLDARMRHLADDDKAWISWLYPAPSFSGQFGVIRGHVLFPDGRTHAQGVNVIARRVQDPARHAVSVVSGFLFTGNPGQEVTAEYLPCTSCPGGFVGANSEGSPHGGRDPLLIGFFEIPVLAGTYTLEVESIEPFFFGGSSVGPLNPPISSPGPPEKWHENESAEDDPAQATPITVPAGSSVPDINFILNNVLDRFDALEGPEARLVPLFAAPEATA